MSIFKKAMSKKRQFVADGVFNAEVNEFLAAALSDCGYAGITIRATPLRTEIVIRAARAREVIGNGGRRIRELTTLLTRRFGLTPTVVNEESIEPLALFVDPLSHRGLSALAQCESLRTKLAARIPVRKAVYGVLRMVTESGAKGVEVTVSGKVRGQRAAHMKYREGYLKSSGNPAKQYVDIACRNLFMPQGMIGIKVKIMKPFDPHGKLGGCSAPMPDLIVVKDPNAPAKKAF